MRFLGQAWVENTVHEVETYWLSCKENVLCILGGIHYDS